LPGESESFGSPRAWRRAGGWGKLPVFSAAVSLGYLGEANGLDCSLTTSVTADIPSTLLADLAGLEWSEAATAWVDEIGTVRARYRETDEGFHRDHVLMLDEENLTRLLDANDLSLAVGLFSERRVFDSQRRSIPRALGWVDYVGHLLFNGKQWESVGLHPYERHRASAGEDGEEAS
jgi:hypothetical protein